jgi:hypothetical protein
MVIAYLKTYPEAKRMEVEDLILDQGISSYPGIFGVATVTKIR